MALKYYEETQSYVSPNQKIQFRKPVYSGSGSKKKKIGYTVIEGANLNGKTVDRTVILGENTTQALDQGYGAGAFSRTSPQSSKTTAPQLSTKEPQPIFTIATLAAERSPQSIAAPISIIRDRDQQIIGYSDSTARQSRAGFFGSDQIRQFERERSFIAPYNRPKQAAPQIVEKRDVKDYASKGTLYAATKATEGEGRLSALNEFVGEKVYKPIGLQYTDQDNYFSRGFKYVVRALPDSALNAPALFGRGVVFGRALVDTKPASKEPLFQAAKETPAALASTYNPTKPEGLVNIGFAALGARNLGRSFKIARQKATITAEDSATFRSSAKDLTVDETYINLKVKAGGKTFNIAGRGTQVINNENLKIGVNARLTNLYNKKVTDIIGSGRGVALEGGGFKFTKFSKVQTGGKISYIKESMTSTPLIDKSPLRFSTANYITQLNKFGVVKARGGAGGITSEFNIRDIATGKSLFYKQVSGETGKPIGINQVLTSDSIGFTTPVKTNIRFAPTAAKTSAFKFTESGKPVYVGKSTPSRSPLVFTETFKPKVNLNAAALTIRGKRGQLALFGKTKALPTGSDTLTQLAKTEAFSTGQSIINRQALGSAGAGGLSIGAIRQANLPASLNINTNKPAQATNSFYTIKPASAFRNDFKPISDTKLTVASASDIGRGSSSKPASAFKPAFDTKQAQDIKPIQDTKQDQTLRLTTPFSPALKIPSTPTFTTPVAFGLPPYLSGGSGGGAGGFGLFRFTAQRAYKPTVRASFLGLRGGINRTSILTGIGERFILGSAYRRKKKKTRR
jgi:hypothetical protein